MLLRKISALFVSTLFFVNALFVSCKTEDSTPFTGLRISADSSGNAGGTVNIRAVYYKEDAADSSSTVTYTLSSDSTDGAYFGTNGTVSTTGKSGSTVTLTLGPSSNASVKVTATCNGSSAEKTIYTKAAFSVNDKPTGYAGVGFTSFYDASKVKTVTTKKDLVDYAKKGGWTIIVDGMIDMSEGMLPTTGGSSTAALDTFVKAKSEYSTYAEYNEALIKSVSAGEDWTNPLNSSYGAVIRLTVASNTAIIGKSAGSGIKGGSIYINGKSNVIIRNLTVQDGYDPFPNHEAGDGWNAQQDTIAIRNSKNVWIDHCTLEDTLHLLTGANGEKWQTYDGLCDITNTSSYVTVSNCILRNHDKTMLIGSGSSDVSGGFITIDHNRFINCGQRLPMTCYKNMHIYNNSYERDSSAYYNQQASIAARYSAYTIIAENNYFGTGVTECITASTKASGKCYQSGNVFKSGSCALSTQSTKPFTIDYNYSLDDASEIPTLLAASAGAGVVTISAN